MLLDENTMTYIFDEEDEKEDQTFDQTSQQNDFIFDVGHTRRYHKCFKFNICINIAMLITFIGLILFGRWYYMRKTDIETN